MSEVSLEPLEERGGIKGEDVYFSHYHGEISGGSLRRIDQMRRPFPYSE